MKDFLLATEALISAATPKSARQGGGGGQTGSQQSSSKDGLLRHTWQWVGHEWEVEPVLQLLCAFVCVVHRSEYWPSFTSPRSVKRMLAPCKESTAIWGCIHIRIQNLKMPDHWYQVTTRPPTKAVLPWCLDAFCQFRANDTNPAKKHLKWLFCVLFLFFFYGCQQFEE